MKKRYAVLGFVILALAMSGCDSGSDNTPKTSSTETKPAFPPLTPEQARKAQEQERKQDKERQIEQRQQQKREQARVEHQQQLAEKQQAQQEKQQAQQEAEQKYHEDFEDYVEAMGDAWTSLGALMGNPNFGDDDWTGEVGHELSILQGGIEAGRKLHAPARYRKVGKAFNQYLDDVQTVPITMAAAVGSSDPQMLASCQPKIVQGTADMKRAMELMDEAGQ
jgi:flagellar motor protein MotB